MDNSFAEPQQFASKIMERVGRNCVLNIHGWGKFRPFATWDETRTPPAYFPQMGQIAAAFLRLPMVKVPKSISLGKFS